MKPRRNPRRESILWAILAIVTGAWILSPAASEAFRPGQPAPEISGGPWINSERLTLDGLKGRVVLVEFWTYG